MSIRSGSGWLRLSLFAALALNIFSGSAAPTSAASTITCNGTFSQVSAASWVAAINPGWNLGNTLDAIPTEGSWNNPPVVGATFDDVKAAGFKSVRIPVTYQDHFIGSSPDWTIDPVWLQRVSDVVDLALARGLYVVTNMHHDSWVDVTQTNVNLTMIEEKFYRGWYQIGQTLACKPSAVALEPINEPPTNTAADGAELNKLNGLFLKALKDSGGFNAQRVVTLMGGGMDIAKTCQWFVAPTGYSNPWAIQFHYYSPYDFIFGAWGKTIWGSESDKAAVDTDFASMRGNFTGIPLVLGEFEANMVVEAAGRRKYLDWVARTAKKYGMSIIVWDNGDGYLDRTLHKLRDPVAIELVETAILGINNSLADSTTNAAAPTQFSSAYIYHKVGDTVVDQTLPFLLNGNTVKSISTTAGSRLSSSAYSVSSGNLTIKSAFLSTYLSSTSAPGTKENLTVTFSAGAHANIEIVQYDVPVLGSSTSAAVSGSDLSIPITWKGLNKLAAVKMLRSDDVYLFDDWTVWDGPLQQAHGTYSGQWNFDQSHVILTSTTVKAVIAAGVSTVFTFEFYPRISGNAVNYTLTV